MVSTILFVIVLLAVEKVIQSFVWSFQLKEELDQMTSDLSGTPLTMNSVRLMTNKLKIYHECIISLVRTLALSTLCLLIAMAYL